MLEDASNAVTSYRGGKIYGYAFFLGGEVYGAASEMLNSFSSKKMSPAVFPTDAPYLDLHHSEPLHKAEKAS